MCGISGGVWTDPARALDRGNAPADDRRAAPSRPGRRRGIPLELRRPAIRRRAWPWGIGGWRSSTLAADTSRWPTKTASIWVVFNGEIYNYRDLRRRLEGGRPPLPHATATPKCWCTFTRMRGPSVRGASRRHVRPGHLGRPAAAVAVGPRSAGRKAAGVSARAGPAVVCQRVEEPAGSAGRAAGDRSAVARRVSDLSIRAASADDLPRHRQAAAGAFGRVSRRAAGSAPAIGTPISTAEVDLPAAGVRRAAPRAAYRRRCAAVAKRRAAGRVSLRRDRFVDHRRA